MGRNRRGAKDSGRVTNYGSQNASSLRELGSGRKQTNTGSGSVKSILKRQHVQKLAVWATGEGSIPSLGAFLGHHLAVCGEALGIAPDPEFLHCQRCESILQPGYNSTVRIERNKSKVRRSRRKKPTNMSTQNKVVYSCHFCSHRNSRRGTLKSHMKEICPPKSNPSARFQTVESIAQKFTSMDRGAGSTGEADRMGDTAAIAKRDERVEIEEKSVARDIPITAMNSADKEGMNETASPAVVEVIPSAPSLATPLVREGTTPLDSMRRKRKKPGPKKEVEPESICDAESSMSKSRRRRRNKSTSLKEIAENSERERLSNIAARIAIPFRM